MTNFVITPLSFLSGAFYSTARLPDFWRAIAHLNPFFYMIDGIRFAVLGEADMNPWLGAAVLSVTNALLWALCHWMFARGYKLKS